MAKVPSRSDPDYEMYEKVSKWNREMECIPSWSEMLEYEYVRLRGEINMVSGDLQRYAFDHCLYHLVNWIQRCRENKISLWASYVKVGNCTQKRTVRTGQSGSRTRSRPRSTRANSL